MAINNCSPNVQAKLSDLHRGKPYRSNIGALDFVYSPANGSQLQAALVQANGKDTRYTITRRQSTCTTIVACDQVECTDTGTATNMTSCDYYDSFSCYSSEWHNAEVSAFRDLGSMNVTEAISGHVYDQINKIKDAIDLALLTSINSNAGSLSTTVATKTYKLIDDSTKAPVWSVDSNIKLDFADAGYPDMPILLGNRTVALWKDSVKRGGLNQNGQYIDAIDTLNAFYDINVNATNTAPTTPGNDALFAILPGVANLITWSANTGIFASRNNSVSMANVDPMRLVNTDNSTYMHTTLTDPATGMVFDFDIVYDPKCKKFQWKVMCYYKAIVLPLIGCKDAAFNGIVKYDVCAVTDPTCL